MKIIFPFSGVGAIFFPVGRVDEGGTCEFATDKCLKECAAFKYATCENIIGYEPKLEAFKFITKNPSTLVCRQIAKELNELNIKILYWFASGDCMKKYTNKIFVTMKRLSSEGIIQCGFTRNKKLWVDTQDISNMRLALTVEGWEAGQKIRDLTGIKGLYALPDYKSGIVTVFYLKWHVKEPRWEYSCPPPLSRRMGIKNKSITVWKIKTIEKEVNCQKCYDNRKGCFTDYN